MRAILIGSLLLAALALLTPTTALAAHHEGESHGKANPCAENPCGANPCADNPCGGNPCGHNPCAEARKANPCAENPCAAVKAPRKKPKSH